jgi:hypothetical protein
MKRTVCTHDTRVTLKLDGERKPAAVNCFVIIALWRDAGHIFTSAALMEFTQFAAGVSIIDFITVPLKICMQQKAINIAITSIHMQY